MKSRWGTQRVGRISLARYRFQKVQHLRLVLRRLPLRRYLGERQPGSAAAPNGRYANQVAKRNDQHAVPEYSGPFALKFVVMAVRTGQISEAFQLEIRHPHPSAGRRCGVSSQLPETILLNHPT
jgi:hypothetical protein